VERRGKVQLKYGDGRKLLVAVGRAPFKKGAPLSEGPALIAYLIGRGSSPY
jgi:hypothetical protein